LGRRDKSGERGAEEKKLLPKVRTKCYRLYGSITVLCHPDSRDLDPDPGFWESGQRILLYPDPDAGFYLRLKVKNTKQKKFKVVKSVASMKGVSAKRSLIPSRNQNHIISSFGGGQPCLLGSGSWHWESTKLRRNL
jgi:hypothetical protein